MTTLYLLSIVDHHPAAIANGNEYRTPGIGKQGPNHWPHTTRTDAERHANDMNRNHCDHYQHVYVTPTKDTAP